MLRDFEGYAAGNPQVYFALARINFILHSHYLCIETYQLVY